jgi:hypothetical protein
MAIATQRIDLTFSAADIAARGAEIIKDIARPELTKQKALGNGVYVLTVDGRRRITIENAKRRIQADFAAAQLEEAIRYVEQAMTRRVPRGTGALRASYRWELDGKPVSAQGLTELQPGQVLAYVTSMRYARWAYWHARQKARQQYTRKVVAGARRQFRSLTVTDQWSSGERQPGIAIRFLKVFARG